MALFTEMHIKVFNFAADMAAYVGQKGEITVAQDTGTVTYHDGTTVGGSAGLPGTVNAVAATGSTIADAAALKTGLNVVTAGDGTKGVILPAGRVGLTVEVKNNAGAGLKVYPSNAAGAVNAIAAGGAITMALNTSAIFKCTDGIQWFTIPLVPS